MHGLFANTYNPWGDPLVLTQIDGNECGGGTVTLGSGAVLEIDCAGGFTYTPEGEPGPFDSFTFTVSDGTDTDTGTVSIVGGGWSLDSWSPVYFSTVDYMTINSGVENADIEATVETVPFAQASGDRPTLAFPLYCDGVRIPEISAVSTVAMPDDSNKEISSTMENFAMTDAKAVLNFEGKLRVDLYNVANDLDVEEDLPIAGELERWFMNPRDLGLSQSQIDLVGAFYNGVANRIDSGELLWQYNPNRDDVGYVDFGNTTVEIGMWFPGATDVEKYRTVIHELTHVRADIPDAYSPSNNGWTWTTDYGGYFQNPQALYNDDPVMWYNTAEGAGQTQANRKYPTTDDLLYTADAYAGFMDQYYSGLVGP